jgi:hypothetical protein
MKHRNICPHSHSHSHWLRCLVVMVGLCASGAGQGAARTGSYCGWWDNPTPSNVWFFDATGEWVVSEQGGHRAQGDAWPDFKDSEKVFTQGNGYGYGCVCIKATVDAKARKVLKLYSARARPLSACRKDPALKRLKFEERLKVEGTSCADVLQRPEVCGKTR